MAISWTRETVQAATSVVTGWTVTQAYNFFGFLVNDSNHTKYSNTLPYSDFFVDMLNEAIQTVNTYAPSRYEVISTTLEANDSVVKLPDYALGTGYIRWVTYGGAKIDGTTDPVLVDQKIAGLSITAFTTAGSTVRYMADDDMHIRLIPPTSTATAMKVFVATQVDMVSSAAMGSAMPVLSRCKQAPSIYMAYLVASREGNVELAREYKDQFWRIVNKKIEDHTSPVDELDIDNAAMWRSTPTWTGDDK